MQEASPRLLSDLEGAKVSITVRSLEFSYPGQSKVILDIESLDISAGVVALIGANGAGKSTFFKCLQGFLKPQKGSIAKVGASSDHFTSAQVFQSEECFEHATVREWIEFHGLLKRIDLSASDIESCIEFAQLSGGDKQLVSKLSGGQQRKLNLACASLGSPDLLILDEPTTGLDQESRKEYWVSIRAFHASFIEGTLLFSSHYMDEVEENADRVLVLKEGHIVQQGSPSYLIDALGLDYVAQVPDSFLSDDVIQNYNVYKDSQGQLVHVPDKEKFFHTYGSVEQLLDRGIRLRKPDMSDVYTVFS